MTPNRKAWLTYACCVMALWIFMPEVRRLAEWRIGGIGSVLAIIPLASMLPAVVTIRSWASGARGVVFLLFVAAFSYATAVGIASGNGVGPVLYTCADFLLPAIFGGWLSQRLTSEPDGFARYGRAALMMVAISAAYGIIAYATMPAWDAQWLAAGGSANISVGVAAPFQFRVFGTMNYPGVFATVVALVMLLNLPLLQQRRPLDIAAGAVCLAALGLSLVRSAWIALVLGLVVYLVLSPMRAKLTSALLLMIISIAIPVTAIVAISGGSDATAGIISRVSSLGDIGHDDSAQNRSSQIDDAYHAAIGAPFGSGLGVFGAVTQLSSSDGDIQYIDSGYLARFVELGLFGTVAMAAAFALALYYGAMCVLSAQRERFGDVALHCSLFAIQVAMVWFNFSGDLLRANPGTLFWIATFALIAAVERGRTKADVPKRLPLTAHGAR